MQNYTEYTYIRPIKYHNVLLIKTLQFNTEMSINFHTKLGRHDKNLMLMSFAQRFDRMVVENLFNDVIWHFSWNLNKRVT